MKIMKRIIKQHAPANHPAQQCNYADNYYGDQVCTITTKNNKEKP